MKALHIQTATEQVTDYLREQLMRGILVDTMPGEDLLVNQLGTGHAIVKAALKVLEEEGLLESQGKGRRRKIVLPKELQTPSLRVRLLLYDREDAYSGHILEIRHGIRQLGHVANFASKPLLALGMEPSKVARMVARDDGDLWAVIGGSRPVLEWFSEQDFPAFALYGRMSGLPIAGARPDLGPALHLAIRKLVGLGHKRIVLIVREQIRKPKLGITAQRFLKGLEEHGLPHGSYNVPDWEDSQEGVYQLIDSLMAVTPPTALIIDQPFLFEPLRHYLALRGYQSPKDISLICIGEDVTFEWCKPSVSHIRWSLDPLIRRTVRWVDRVSRGKEDRRQTFTKTEFIEAGTIGPAKG
jgi:ribosomal protein S25